jgi:chromosome segregation ATPase
MASHDFQTALSNYLDLEDLRTRLVSWETSFGAFEDIIGLRKQNYDPLLPEVDADFRELDSQIRLRMEQREHLDKRLQGMLTAPRPDYLATADERIVSERLDQLERQLIDPESPQEQALQQRIAHVRGALTWRLRTQYHERLTEAHTHLNELNVVIAAMTERYQSLVRTRQAATHSYVGYDVPINQLRRRVGEALQKVNRLMARQGHLLETVAINELKARRERLDAYQTQARFAVADSYDRAARLQADVRPDGAQAGSVKSGEAQPVGVPPGGGQQ